MNSVQLLKSPLVCLMSHFFSDSFNFVSSFKLSRPPTGPRLSQKTAENLAGVG